MLLHQLYGSSHYWHAETNCISSFSVGIHFFPEKKIVIGTGKRLQVDFVSGWFRGKVKLYLVQLYYVKVNAECIYAIIYSGTKSCKGSRLIWDLSKTRLTIIIDSRAVCKLAKEGLSLQKHQ